MKKRIIYVLLAVFLLPVMPHNAFARNDLSTFDSSALSQEEISFAEDKVDELFGSRSLSEEERDQLIIDTCEKYFAPSSFSNSLSSSSVSSSAASDVYERYLERIAYIIDLINELGETTDEENMEYNLAFLQDHYQEIAELEDVDLGLVDWYIEETTYALISQDFPAFSVKPAVRANYSRTAAVSYAEQYYADGSYNPDYPDWSASGGDCANFVSQCIHAGGKAYNVSASSVSAAKAADWANWYSYGNTCNTTNVSSTHRGANAFKSYWQSKVSYSTFTSVGQASYTYGYQGDAISLLLPNGSAYHTLLIVGYDAANNDFIVSAHTHSTFTDKLSAYSPSNGFIIFSMG
ncbi:MAG: amidase domain-containing protein [Clostridium sp.]|nr:amidase domain-containing protein [Clostridium sp.]